MKKARLFILVLTGITACKKDDSVNQKNPYLTQPYVNLTIDLTLPQYNNLNYPGNHLVLYNQGIRGIVIYNENNTNYHAQEISDPNHIPNDCSAMEIEGIQATCMCASEGDNPNRYNIITGQHLDDPGEMYPMLRYKITRTGNTIVISNM